MRQLQRGLTLIELLLAMTLGMGVALAAIALLSAAKTNYLAINDGVQVQENGRYALDLIARAIRQANHVPHDHPLMLHAAPAALPAGIQGLDNARLPEQSEEMSSPSPNAVAHGSDVLTIRFSGAEGMLNCAGIAVPAPVKADAASSDQGLGRSVFYVAPDAAGEPELRCKYPTRKGGWSAAAVVRGVESFQVLYGVRDGDDHLQFLNATRMSSRWRDVVAVRVALLMRGEHNVAGDAPIVHHLFGPDYAGSADPGVVIDEARLAPHLQQRIRKVFDTTVQLRNRPT